MNFYVYINGKTHKLVQGFTINEEYNETLDSASIIISDSPQLDINPYDDVFIYSEYCGIFDVNKNKIVPNYQQKFNFKGYPVNNSLYDSGEMPFFYKHFLIYKFVEKIIILGEDESDTRYEYTIELFSETKGLETVQAPNISITQPLNSKISTVTYTNRFLSLYNKRIKKTASTVNNWTYYSKYTLGDINKNKYLAVEDITENGTISYNGDGNGFIFALVNFNGTMDNLSQLPAATVNNLKYKIPGATYYWLTDVDYNVVIEGTCDKAYIYNDSYIVKALLTNVSDIFGQSYTPDFTLNNPSLRQILEKLFITKDCIPVVHDDQIYAMDITLRRGKFDLRRGQINYITGSKDSGNYCTDLKRTYSDALTQENSSRFVDFLGFRNSDSGLLTLDNLRIETRFPIYKINKIYMCYFKRFEYQKDNDAPVAKVFLCKQDITPLVKLNSERNVLSEDVEEFRSYPMKNINDLARYKLATVGYDIGSKYIDGWGTKYSYPTDNFFWQTEIKSYIENLFTFMDKQYPYGIYNFDYLIKKIVGDGEIPEKYGFYLKGSINNTIVIPDGDLYDETEDSDDEKWWDKIKGFFDSTLAEENLTLHLKHLFFEIDYNGFYNGTVIHSKGLGKDNLTMNDNPSASLSLLELDGLAQKEKLDRYGNKGIQINARYKDINDVQLLGSVYEHNNDKDVVIYHKEYSINDNVIDCFYSGTKDYVLKDYFTSVYAKHRTYNLMSYGESITRSENQKIYFFISKNRIIQDKNLGLSFSGFDTNFIKTFFSFFKAIEDIEAEGRIDEKEKMNYGYFQKDNKIYATDVNVFVSGVSLCLNICMFDNITSGTLISKMKNYYFAYNTTNYVIGATQKWVNLVDSMTTGEINSLTFGFGHIQSGQEYGYIDEDKVYDSSSFDVNGMYNKLLNLPEIVGSPNIKNRLYFTKNIYKDNKEKIDMTLQIEPMVDNDIYLSPWVSKLSDLFSIYEKYNNAIQYTFYKTTDAFQDLIYTTRAGSYGGDFHEFPVIIIALDKKYDDWLENYPPQLQVSNLSVLGGVVLDQKASVQQVRVGRITYFTMNINEVVSVSEGEMKIKGDIRYYLGDSDGDDDEGHTLNNYQFTLSSSRMDSYMANPGETENIYDDVKNTFLSATGLTDDDVQVYMCSITTGQIINQSFEGKEWACWAGTGDHYYQTSSYEQQQNLIGTYGETARDPKLKNLYWVYTPADYEFKPYMVYDELGNLNQFSPLNVWINGDPVTDHDIQFTWTGSNKLEIIHPSLEYGSHILCYYRTADGKYNFVFGFKPDESSSGSGHTNWYTELNISLLSFKDLTVYDKDSNLPVGEIPTDGSIPII